MSAKSKPAVPPVSKPQPQVVYPPKKPVQAFTSKPTDSKASTAASSKPTPSSKKEVRNLDSSSSEEESESEEEDSSDFLSTDDEDDATVANASSPAVAQALALSKKMGPRRSSVANHAAGGIFSPQLIAEVKQRFNEFCSWVLALTLEAINGPYGTAFIAVCTVFAIFMDDVRIWAVPKANEEPVYVVMTIIFALFLFEWIVNSIWLEGYFGSFFWYLDIVSMMSLIPDIPVIWDHLLVAFGVISSTADQATTSANLQATAQYTALGTRAGRVLKLVRLVRVVRIAKLFDTCIKNRNEADAALHEEDRIKREKEILEAKINAAMELQKSLRKQGAKAVADKTDKNVNAAVIKAREAQREREKQREIDRLQKEERERLAKFETDRQNKLKQKEEERKKLEAEKKRLDEESKKAKSDAQQAEASRAAERKAALMKQKANAENSRVGEHLSEKTTRRVIVMVLAMLFGVPALESSVVNPSEQNGLDYLTMLADTNGTTWGTFNAAINQYQSFNSLNQWHLIAIRIQGKTFGNTSLSYINTFQPLTDFRDTELIFLTSTNAMGGTNIATFDVSSNARLSGAYGVLLTLAVVILLAVGSALFSSDADAIVITPIKRMIDVIEAMKRNPLARIGTGATGDAKKIAKEKAAKLQALNIPFFTHPWEATKMFFMKLFGYVKVPDDALEGETDILEQTLQKLSGLLQVGFGEAGASIIQRNLGDGELNAMVEGERKLAIFGFCDVRHFADITQCLQGDIFLFVNTVAEIVHSEVSRCQGAANKNIGEAFLVAWKLPKDLLEEDLDLVVNSGADSTEVACLPAARRNAIDQSRVLVDKALTAFLRVILRVAASEELRNFGKNAAIKAVFGNDFQVSMGFGLHVGWAIEGAIGSTYKIDASYLSPNVNMAARLEAATRQFNVPLLLSGPFHSLLTPKHAEKCRRIDIVKVKGSAQPMPLYCFDIFPKLIDELRPPVEPILSDELTQHIRNNADGLRKPHAPERVYSHILYLLDHKLMSTHASFTADSTDVTIQPIDWEKDPQLSVLQSGFNRTFFDVFAGGVEEYLRGDWPAAEQTLQEVMDKHKPNDGPTQVLLNYMRNRNCTAPADWDGCRALTSK